MPVKWFLVIRKFNTNVKYKGGPFGTVLSMPFTGWMSGTHLGWPYAFYIYGAFGLGWVVLWSIFGRDSPAEHPNIDPSERKYIEASLGQTENKIVSKLTIVLKLNNVTFFL